MQPSVKDFQLTVSIELPRQEERRLSPESEEAVQTELYFRNCKLKENSVENKRKYEIAYKLFRWANECNVKSQVTVTTKEGLNSDFCVADFTFKFQKFNDMYDFINFFSWNVFD